MANDLVSRVAVLFLFALGCGEASPPFQPAPAPPMDWHTCVREGAIRRARCPRHFQQCGDRAAAMGIACYQTVWRSQRSATDRTRVGPRWAYDLAKAADRGELGSVQYAEGLCGSELASLPREACIDEVVFAIDVPFIDNLGGGP